MPRFKDYVALSLLPVYANGCGALDDVRVLAEPGGIVENASPPEPAEGEPPAGDATALATEPLPDEDSDVESDGAEAAGDATRPTSPATESPVPELTIEDPLCLSSGDYEYDVNAWLKPTLPMGIVLDPATAWARLAPPTSHSVTTTRGVLGKTAAPTLSDIQQATLEFVHLGNVADEDAAYLSSDARRWQVALKLRALDAAGTTLVYVTWRFRELSDDGSESGPSLAIQVKRNDVYYEPAGYLVEQALDGSPIEAPTPTSSISHVNVLRAELQNQSLKAWITRYGDVERLVWDGRIDTDAAAPGATWSGLIGFRTDNVAARLRVYGSVDGETHSYLSTTRDCATEHAALSSP